MKNHPLLSKFVTAALVALALLIPLSMIESKIAERQALQQNVQQDIARSSAGPQTLNGPYLVIKYRVRLHRTEKDKQGNVKGIVFNSEQREKVIAPNTLKIDGTAAVKTRWRGIYEARLFELESAISGDFDVPVNYGINSPLQDVIIDSSSFVLGISDARGILNSPALTINGEQRVFSPGSASMALDKGIHAALPLLDPSQRHVLSFEFPLNLLGMSTLAVVPAGSTTQMSLKSAWPHPSFGGDFLPRDRTVDRSGFTAAWSVSNLAHNAPALDDSRNSGAREARAQESFSVGFIDPVNVYLMSQRAVKYGILFVVLVFTAFFMFETMGGLRIHPLQYALVGLAMAMFFLLLISLSEHIPFLASYVVSGAACVALIGAYLAGALRNGRLAAAFSGGLGLLYAVLYGVLKSEDNALLMGALMLFAALAAVMMFTRHTDWYELAARPRAEPR
jgi:inner membrane protein